MLEYVTEYTVCKNVRETQENAGRQTHKKDMTIAVDFDGTIVEHCYPEIGKEIIFATDTLKALIKDGHQLILWTVREGELLEEAVEWCRERGVEFFAVNKNYPEENVEDPFYSRKLKAEIFIDDRNIGGLTDWGVIYRMISERKTLQQILEERIKGSGSHHGTRKKRWWQL